MARYSTTQSDGTVSATLATSVFGKLRSDILQGVISPGEKLRIDALRERYQTGASPLREALNRLSALHLVEQIEQKGFRVTVITPEKFIELARTRCWISEIAVREAIKHGDTAWEEKIVLAHYRLQRRHELNKAYDAEGHVLHRSFHLALIEACPSHWILEFHETLFDLADRVRHMSYSNDRAGRDVAGEHRAIMEAVIGRDTANAIRLLNEHFERTTELAISSMRINCDK